MPSHASELPVPLLELTGSLVAQSRHRASTLKAEEEIARLYACAHIACDRYDVQHSISLHSSRARLLTSPHTDSKPPLICLLSRHALPSLRESTTASTHISTKFFPTALRRRAGRGRHGQRVHQAPGPTMSSALTPGRCPPEAPRPRSRPCHYSGSPQQLAHRPQRHRPSQLRTALPVLR